MAEQRDDNSGGERSRYKSDMVAACLPAPTCGLLVILYIIINQNHHSKWACKHTHMEPTTDLCSQAECECK